LTQIQISGITFPSAKTEKVAAKKEVAPVAEEVEAPKKKVAKAKKVETQE
jgi:large subunit ribosomal protein L21